MLHRLTTLTSREAPAHIVRALREIDHRAELVELIPGKWILGIVVPNDERIRRGTALMEQELRKDKGNQELSRLRFAHLCMDGFGQVALYEMKEPDSRIVEDFRERDFNYRHYLNKTQQEFEDEVEGVTRQARTKKYAIARAEALGKELFRTIFRKRRAFSGKGDDYGKFGKHLSKDGAK